MGRRSHRAAGLALVLSLAGTGAARASVDGARTRVVVLDRAVQAIPGEIPLRYTQRLTFILPEPVRMAVPGSPDVLAVHVQGEVVAVSLVESEYVRVRRPVSNLTIVTEDGAAVTCRIRPAGDAEAVPADVIRVERGPALRARASAGALRLIREWLAAGAAPDGEAGAALAALEPLVERRARRDIARAVAAGGREVVRAARRPKRDFIYLTSHGLARLGPDAVVHLEVTNHSQPTFTIGDVSVRVAGRPLPRESVVVAAPDPVVAPDGRPRGVAVLASAAALLAGPAEVRICERAAAPRCVALAVREP